MSKFDGKPAVITGATSGMGVATARLLAAGVQADSGTPVGHGRVDVVYASAGIGSLAEPLEAAVKTASFGDVFG